MAAARKSTKTKSTQLSQGSGKTKRKLAGSPGMKTKGGVGKTTRTRARSP